ncbi:MAG: cell wall hydrolase [Halanaerobiales bacterium]|nr:cell wall hydrolase [Halanaerobiales bacterium]
MKFFSRGNRQKIASIVLINLILPMIFLLVLATPVYAEDLSKEDAYKGLAIAVGIILLAKLMKNLFTDNSPNVPSGGGDVPTDYSEADLGLLARLIFSEARGESYQGQIAVAAVVLNRIQSDKFPNTVSKVIYQPNQFSSVNDGQINLIPNATAYQAARDALSGKDPSKGALFFYNPKTAKNMDWFRTLKTTIIIGNHVFAI